MMVQLRLTNWCNIGCDHCMIPKIHRTNKQKLSDEFYKNIATLVNYNTQKTGLNHLRLSFTGGEPLTLSSDFLSASYTNIAKYLRKEIVIDHRLTTSLIAYKASHATYIRQYVDVVKTSLDFSTRKIKGMVSNYHKLWCKKYNQVKLLGKKIIVNTTLTKAELGKSGDIVDRFFEYGISDVQISQFFKTGVPAAMQSGIPSNLEQSKMYCQIFDIVIAHYAQGKYINIDICKTYPKIALNLPMVREDGCQQGFFVIEPTGKISTCTMTSSLDKGIGNIVKQDTPEILFAPERLKRIRYQQQGFQSNCLRCEYFKNCNRRVCLNMPNNQEECMGYKTFLDYIQQRCEDQIFKKTVLSYLNSDGINI